MWKGMFQQDMKNKEVRIHPTQKPVALYDWIFKKYAKPGDKIIDTHLGSGSSRIAANKANLEFWGYELDKEYFDDQEKRYNNFASQLRIF
jgi:site-specific DNA-methyltransferase (adenine-specific)